VDVQASPIPVPRALATDPRQAAQALGRLLYQTPDRGVFLEALNALNGDLTVKRLGAQLRSHQSALQWGRDEDGQHAPELARLEREMQTLPVVQEYRQAEAGVRQLFCAVDEIVSQEAGVAFAVNAKRGGCCGG